MDTKSLRYKPDRLGIIWAITQKDLLDAFRSRTIIIIFLTGLFLVALYNFLPAISKANEKPILAVLSTANANSTEKLETSQEFTMVRFEQREEFETFLGSKDNKVMGIILPANFNAMTQDTNQMTLQGYVDHWLSPKKRDELQVYFEDQLTQIFQKPVQVEIDSKIFTNMKAFFIFNHTLALVIILMLMGMYITPNIMMEEKQKKTMDALLLSPANPVMVVISKALTSLIFCLSGTLIALVVYGRFIVHWEIMVAAFIVGTLLFTSLGLLVGVWLSTPAQLGILFVITQPLIIPLALSFAEGVFAPPIETIIDWTPTGALIDCFKAAMVNNIPGSTYLKMAIVLAYALLSFAFVSVKLKRTDR